MASRRLPVPGRAPATEGLSALDRDRASSLADEGGASAAAVEAREDGVDPRAEMVWTRPRSNGSWRTATFLAIGAMGVLAVWTVARRRGRA